MSREPQDAFPAGRWRARWIWCEPPRIEMDAGNVFSRRASEDGTWGCFRRTFELAQLPARAPARITADSRYVLWVNGAELARGPVRSNLRRLHYDGVDLAPHLRPGRNAVAVLARFFGRSNPWWAPAPAVLQLGAGALLFEARLGDAWLVSDGEWRALRCDAWQDLPGSGAVARMAPESFDARGLAPGWREADFDDADWDSAIELDAYAMGFTGRHEPPSQPYGALLPRPVALLGLEPREGRVARVATAARQDLPDDPVDAALHAARRAHPSPADGSWTLPLTVEPDEHSMPVVSVDFGEVVCGTVVLEVEAPAGARIDVAAAEFATAAGVPDPDGEHCGFRYVARGRDDCFETFAPLGLRWLALAVDAYEPVTLHRVAVHERLHPRARAQPRRVQRDAPCFACSDPLLDRIWAVGRRTVDLDSHDAYLDCPTREQRAWTGDFVVHQMVDLATHEDWRLADWNVELAASPRPDGMLPMAAAGDIEFADGAYIPDWALHWIRALYNLHRYRGDRGRVAQLLPTAEGVLRWFVPFQAEDDLLTDVTGWVIIDWSAVSTEGKSSVLNALWARGLRDFAEMAEWLGDAGRVAWARELHARVAESFDLFWDPGRSLYVDHVVDGARQPATSQHAQAAPLSAGLIPADRTERVLEVMLDRSRHVHAAWSVPRGDARRPGPGEDGIGGPYLFLGPSEPWWDLQRQLVVAQPFFRYVVHDAVAEAGHPERIPELCRDWAVLLERCATSWSETWYGGTVSHAWSATPTRDLIWRTLGVTPAEPGFGVARVAPRLGDLDWARGAVPTPRGLLHIEVDGGCVRVESPLPFELDLDDTPAERRPAGRYEFVR